MTKKVRPKVIADVMSPDRQQPCYWRLIALCGNFFSPKRRAFLSAMTSPPHRPRIFLYYFYMFVLQEHKKKERNNSQVKEKDRAASTSWNSREHTKNEKDCNNKSCGKIMGFLCVYGFCVVAYASRKKKRNEKWKRGETKRGK